MGTLNNRCRTIIGTPKGTIFLTTTRMGFSFGGFEGLGCVAVSGFRVLADFTGFAV